MRTRSKLPAFIGRFALAALAIALLGAAAREPYSRSGTLAYSIQHCPNAIQSGGSDYLWLMYQPARFVQPIGTTATIAGAQIDISTDTFAGGVFSVVYWDPATLAPDPTTVALRTLWFDVSVLAWNGGAKGTFTDPPLVLRTIPGLAEPPRMTTALDYRAIHNYYSVDSEQDLFFSPDGDAATPIGYYYSGTSTTPTPLPGDHGVLSHAICGAGVIAADLTVCQSVMRSDSLLSDRYAVAQKFRVPVATKLDWVELAFGTTTGGYALGTLAILDAEGMTTPPASPSAAMALANFDHWQENSWGSHYPFNQNVVLVPGHDYWLWATTNRYNTVYARKRTGTEGADFAAIGSFWSQPLQGSAWFNHPVYSLDFKILGEPVANVDVGGPAPRRPGGLQMTVGPNPARSSTAVTWSGAKGGLLLEVYDPSGRRVATESRDEAEGHWAWWGARERDAGLYFVLARDAAGQSASVRVAIMR